MWINRVVMGQGGEPGGPLRPTPRWRIGRDTILFLVGIGGIINESFIRTGDPRTELLILFAGMCGLPAFFRVDEKGNGPKDG